MACSSGTNSPISPLEGFIVPTKATTRMSRKLFRGLKRESGRNCRECPNQQKIAQVPAGSEKSDCECDGGRSKKGCACDNSDLKWTEAQLGQICWQDDDRESVAKAARSARGV